jgi:hypothetical protein
MNTRAFVRPVPIALLLTLGLGPCTPSHAQGPGDPAGGAPVLEPATTVNTVTPRLVRRHLYRPALPAETQTFSFDSGTPALTVGQNAPFDQTVGGVVAHFSGPFSVQNDSSTHYVLSRFTGQYLYPNGFGPVLVISFNRQLSGISLVFATADFQQVEVPTTIQLTGYQGSVGTTAVGSTTAHGSYGSDTMPMGSLSFTSSQPFNVVEVRIPPAPGAAAFFLVDTITVDALAGPAR